MSVKLFNVKEGVLVVNTPEILAVESFKDIIKRDKNVINNTTKTLAFKELAYVWFIADYDSPLNKQGKAIKDASKIAIDKVGLDSSWKPDAIIHKAIADYKDLNFNVAKEVIDELLKTFAYYGKVVGKVRKSIEVILDTNSGLTKTQAQEIVELMSTVMAISKGIPNEIKNLTIALTDLNTDATKEYRDQLRGTEETVPDSADPDKDF